MHSEPRFLLAGDAGLVVELGNKIDEEINRRVRSLATALAENPIPGLAEMVPTYRSLLVHYDPLRLSHRDLVDLIRSILEKGEEYPLPEPRMVEIPTLYGVEFGPDLPFVAEHNGLSMDEVIRIHSGTVYPVYMLGFSPGYAYLGGLPEEIATPRLPTPRTLVPAGSVALAGRQTGVYPIATPGGWRLIGRTPLKLFDPQRDPPTLLRAGDQVRFVPISEEEYWARLEREEEKGGP
jgi:KipI family sensor histidine kinase inhibitor